VAATSGRSVSVQRSESDLGTVLNRQDDLAACYTRFSSRNQSEKSIDDQLRENRTFAKGHGHTIPDSLHFTDHAISGATVVREGLDALREAAKKGLIRTLYVYSLSRLSRETTFGLPLLKELHYVHKIRILSVSEGIDTDREGWYEVSTIINLFNERLLKEMSKNTRRGLIGTVVQSYSVGDYVFGYTSVPAPNGAMHRRGGIDIPRRVYAILEEQVPWVVRIFHWYVVEGRSTGWIAKELTALFIHAEKTLGIPRPDTRSRRDLSEVQKSIEPEVVAQYQAGRLLDEIANSVGVSRPTVHRCLKSWHEEHGLPLLDGRARRKTLEIKERPQPDAKAG
jgi:DNA invertase Pin-like site-specific DNA recombinase